MSSLVKLPIQWVDSQSLLETCCRGWQRQSLLAIDTEFMRSQTYYPKAALIQVNDGGASALIDPTADLDFSAFRQLLFSADITKVLHSCTEDLEVFHRLFGALPVNVFDTQIAAAALGYGYSLGYAALVKALQGADIPKGETRSDWLQRPLSVAQINYAAVDVEYLYPLAQSLMDALKRQGRSHWIEEECRHVLQQFSVTQRPEWVYQKVKGAWKLDQRQLACLKDLFVWREQTAQRRDVPRNRVMKEHALLKLVQRRPRQVAHLRNFEGISERMVRADGEQILEIIDRAWQKPTSELPAVAPPPLSGDDNKIIRSLRSKVEALAASLGVAPELLAKKRDYEQLLRNDAELPRSLSGWRKDVVGDKLQAWLKQMQCDDQGTAG